MAIMSQKLGITMLLYILVIFLQKARSQPSTNLSQPTTNMDLTNKHLRVAVSYWKPFLMWDCPGGTNYEWEEDCPGNRTYDGVMWDFLLFMKRAKNVTFTLVHEPEYIWGYCSEVNNCSGMVGMVNKNEVDFGLGKLNETKVLISRNHEMKICTEI